MVGKSQQPFDETSLLTSEEQDAILAKAREEVRKERADEAMKSFLDKALIAERKKNNVGPKEEEMVQLLIDLPGFTNALVINNHQFFHGYTYTVPVSKARDMASMMARAWEHENEVGGANRDQYRKPSNQVLRPGNQH